MRLNRVALVVGAILAPFAASGLVVVAAGWIEAITGNPFDAYHVANLASIVAIGVAVAAGCAVFALWDKA